MECLSSFQETPVDPMPLRQALGASAFLCGAFLPLFACPAASATAAPAPRIASVTDAEVAEWSRYIELSEGASSRLDRARKVEEIVILQTLAARVGEGPDAELRLRQERLDEELAMRRLELRLRALATPTEEELRSAFASRIEEFRRPRRWRLSDLFKAVPPGADGVARDQVRRRMEELRVRLQAGESFAGLAVQESESATRERGGADGFVALADLRPALARVVAELEPGELSPVLEIPGGFVLLLCGGVDPGSEPTFDAERQGLADELRNAKVRSRLDAIASAVDAELAAASSAGSPSAHPRSRSELLDAEARRLGWVSDDDDRILTRWRGLAVRAQLAADRWVAQRVAQPTAAEIEAAWRSASPGWRAPRARHLRALTLEIDRRLGAEPYERFLAAGRALAAMPPASRRPAALEGLRDEVAPASQLEDLGWLTDDEVWALGKSADEAIASLQTGAISAPTQEGRRLRLFELVAVRPERRKSLEEALPDVRAALLEAQARQSIDHLRREILAAAAEGLQ